ncbi:hypothetical protein J5N97_000096 [Dioscorea zingiberensis]|uniref:F-box domain-containing protein n=1 Tax=Dioscorea zingiberensis TaxID=325984 RepID=A0A9D5H1Q6_9LILI|nr:hypothetical protein J5N97_000096 [Dioscorea zingiberensis]
MSSLRVYPDLTSRVYPEPDHRRIDHFDRLPDSLLLLVFNKIGDVKALGRCCVVSRRFHSLVPQVEKRRRSGRLRHLRRRFLALRLRLRQVTRPFSSLFRLVFGGIVKPLQALGQFLGPRRSSSSSSSASSLAVGNEDDGGELEQAGVTHHSPPRADFGSTLDNCVILGASSVIQPGPNKPNDVVSGSGDGVCPANAVTDDNGSIPDSFYTNGGLKLRVVWTISSLIAASARHYLLQPIISEHKTLEQPGADRCRRAGVLYMNREQLEELRVKPLSASSASKRTLVPALNMRLWVRAPVGVAGWGCA